MWLLTLTFTSRWSILLLWRNDTAETSYNKKKQRLLALNPLRPNSDQHPVSPCNNWMLHQLKRLWVSGIWSPKKNSWYINNFSQLLLISANYNEIVPITLKMCLKIEVWGQERRIWIWLYFIFFLSPESRVLFYLSKQVTAQSFIYSGLPVNKLKQIHSTPMLFHHHLKKLFIFKSL